MSNQRPIFNSGLYGKANRTVMNAFMDSADTLAANQGAIDWAYRASMPEPFATRTFLARIQTATVITANCRWSYAGTEAVLLSASPWHEIVTGSNYDFTGALNLRELFNTSGTDIDGMDISTPASTVGPVGSAYASAAWGTTGLEALVVMTMSYTKTGTVSYYFDRPNPIRCT
jgi:hypothetical protein